VNLICADHLQAQAVARCVSCGRHLCRDCRTRVGVRNFCSACRTGHQTIRSGLFRSPPLHPAEPAAAAASAPVAEVAAIPATYKRKSPTLAALLSVIPGLGQAYAGLWLRGVLFFVVAQGLKDWSQLTPLLASFLYVFNLFDAYRVAANRNERSSGAAPRSRRDETLFTMLGLGATGLTLVQLGGFAALGPATLIPLAAVAGGLLLAQETRP